MFSFKALAAAVLLSATAATPVFAQAPVSAQYSKNLRDSGYNPKNDYNPNGTMRAAIQEPGLFAFYYPNLDVLNGGAPTPAARLSPDWPALRGACASAGGGIIGCHKSPRCAPLLSFFSFEDVAPFSASTRETAAGKPTRSVAIMKSNAVP